MTHPVETAIRTSLALIIAAAKARDIQSTVDEVKWDVIDPFGWFH